MTKNGTWQAKHKSVRFGQMYLYAVLDRYGYLLTMFGNREDSIAWAAMKSGATVTVVKK
jgi:hypothetical protein